MPTGNSWLLNQSSLNSNENSLANSFFRDVYLFSFLEVTFAIAMLSVLLNKSLSSSQFHQMHFLPYNILIEVYVRISDKVDTYKH